MAGRFFSAGSLWMDEGILLARVITGVFMIYHGYEVFDTDQMKGYEQWLGDLHFPNPSLMAYLVKGTELAGGVLLTLGFLTRLAALALAMTMAVITFGMGKGKILTDDQHAFLFVVICVLFIFTGAGKWSLDRLIFGSKNRLR